jgi:hypothetical protein
MTIPMRTGVSLECTGRIAAIVVLDRKDANGGPNGADFEKDRASVVRNLA